tara:strand:- start:3679 stop:4587 length:909 start_codon:yes stop_codon:yes gene_type:complete
MSLNILVIGMGAIGSLYASKCSKEHHVYCVARSDATHIQQHGIKIKHPDNVVTTFHPKICYSQLSKATNKFDYIIIATKEFNNQVVFSELGGVVHNKTVLVLIQNGLYIESNLQKQFPNHLILSCLAFVCVTKCGPGYIHHQDYGRLVVGKYPKGMAEPVRVFADLFKQSNVNCAITDHIVQDRYKKLLWNASFNSLSVIYGGKNTVELLADCQIETRIRNIMQNVKAVAIADNCNITETDIEKNINDTKLMKPYKTSMCIDWENNRNLEIEAILGNVIKRAYELNVDCPYLVNAYNELNCV